MKIFVGIQPILDRHNRTFAYELLFRSGTSNGFDGTDAVAATRAVLSHTFLSIGAEKILGSHKGFVNFSRESLLDGSITALPPSRIVIEILETVAVDSVVLDACRLLRRAGYQIALDDFVMRPDFEPLLELADFIKVDFRATSREECRRLAQSTSGTRARMLAEKVETMDEVNEALAMGYEYFQGYFFARPQIVSASEVPSYKLNSLRILKELHKPELDFKRLEWLTRMDVSLARKLLRYVNSAVFGCTVPVHSIQHALVLLGESETRKLLSLALLPSLVSDKPLELVRMALVRGRTCELIASGSALGDRAGDCFLMGLFSLLDAMMGRPLDALIGGLGLAGDVCAALTAQSAPGDAIQTVYDICLACESADTSRIEPLSGTLGIAGDEMASLYLNALHWSDDVCQAAV
jgi:c-di-GMP-related signal transduction protein